MFKQKSDRQTAPLKPANVIAASAKALCKGLQHFLLGKGNRNLHSQIPREEKFSCQKTGQPPVTLPGFKQKSPLMMKGDRHWQKLFIRRAGKFCFAKSAFRNHPICMVQSHLPAGVDSVLAFPELQQPGAASIIKIDGFTVKHHVKMYRRFVKGPAISELPLPGIHRRLHNAGAGIVKKAKGLQKLIHTANPLLFIQTAHFFRRRPSPPKQPGAAKRCQQ